MKGLWDLPGLVSSWGLDKIINSEIPQTITFTLGLALGSDLQQNKLIFSQSKFYGTMSNEVAGGIIF